MANVTRSLVATWKQLVDRVTPVGSKGSLVWNDVTS